MRIELRYVKRAIRRRKRKDGSIWQRAYYYYRRDGAPDNGKPLPGAPGEPAFMAALAAFNDRAEGGPAKRQAGTFSALVEAYLASPEYADKAASTQKEYKFYLRRAEEFIGQVRVAEIDADIQLALRDRFKHIPFAANYLARVLSLVLNWGAGRRPKQLRVRPRDRIWSDEEIAAFMRVADEPMQRALMVHLYTAQRQGDCLSLTWSQIKDGHISLRQSKTGKRLEIRMPQPLHEVLSNVHRTSTHVLTDERGLPWNANTFRHRWLETMKKAGLKGVQNRDLRRTAMVWMAHEGVEVYAIAAVSGHTITQTMEILRTYLPPDAKMAEAGIRGLERAATRSKPKA
ncbi:tyrosine-type recombinase/integrase [Roseicella aquatilis]|uniref:Tyr recombinase domain-containing protein n=1 Tax=Roseicella aquatilis TaxID=2527868 RepID=A0A4R4DUK3_9PROT|nr:tyrosine-type recombinase/integrase [Roseicella aquatilis]TCZ65565.1 hypothetical protein EXY23_05195 [Roseicella aquatilis]